MLRLTLFLIILSLSINIYSQNCTPTSKISLTKDEINEERIEALLGKFKPEYQKEEMDSIRKMISNCKLRIDEQLQAIKDSITFLRVESSDIIKYKDVEGIKKQIAEFEESKAKSNEKLKQNLKSISHTGLFAVLLKGIDIYEDKLNIIGEAKKTLNNKAIEDLNGVYVERYSSTTDFQEVKDAIESFISGEVRVVKEYLSHSNYKYKYFLYVTNVDVNPLIEDVLSSDELPLNASVINLLLEKNYEDILRAEGVTEVDLKRLNNEVNEQVKNSIKKRNANLEKNHEEVLTQGTADIDELNRAIEDARTRLRDRKEKIQEKCKKFKVPFDKDNINESAHRAMDFLEIKIEQLNKEWNQIKDKEIFFKEADVPIEGKPEKALATKAIEIYQQLKEQYGQFEKRRERIKVVDFKVTNHTNEKVVKVFREVEKVWIYPVPQENSLDHAGYFVIEVYAKFRITDESELIDTIPRNVKEDFEKGKKHFDDERYKFAFQYFLNAAKKNNSSAQHYLGQMYKEGLGVEEDSKLAFEWFEKAALQDHPEALFELSNMYLRGIVTEKNMTKAKEACKKAADLGHKSAALIFEIHYSDE